MRKVVVYEGKTDGKTLYYINPGALTCSRDRIPVSVYGDEPGSDYLRGYASGFARDEATGEISFEIEMDPGYEYRDFVLEHYEPSIFISPFERERDKDVVLKGEIRGVTFIPPSGANPRTRW